MRLNDFSVRVIGGREVAGGYVEIEHGKQYSLSLRNSRSTSCDAEVMVDGRDCGAFRIDPNTGWVLERPSHDKGRFTAYLQDSEEGRQAQIELGNSTGLISVTFTPEKKIRPLREPRVKGYLPYDLPDVLCKSEYIPCSMEEGKTVSYCASGEPMGTGLSGCSNQSFHTVPDLDLDYDQRTTINLRLVSGEGPRPLSQNATPVPPRLG